MNFADAEICRHCQHQFRTGIEKAPAENAPAIDELHRTQMFQLPSLPQRAASSAEEQAPPHSRIRLRAWLETAIHSPLLLAAGVVVILVCLIVFAAFALGIFAR
jgi:hypothetical protein